VTLVHEFQHSELSVVPDLTRLYDAGPDEFYYAPWRNDPRPFGGLLQGVYAFIGVADTCRCLAARPYLSDTAQREFCRCSRAA
jgi:HEXXH motif-containing protein